MDCHVGKRVMAHPAPFASRAGPAASRAYGRSSTATSAGATSLV